MFQLIPFGCDLYVTKTGTSRQENDLKEVTLDLVSTKKS